jgi:hypothetical protein
MESSLVSGIKSLAQTTSSFLPEPLASGVSFASQLIPGQSGQVIDISPSYQALIDQQIQVQLEQQHVTFTSNMEKSRHESRMAAVRNIRVG